MGHFLFPLTSVIFVVDETESQPLCEEVTAMLCVVFCVSLTEMKKIIMKSSSCFLHPLLHLHV